MEGVGRGQAWSRSTVEVEGHPPWDVWGQASPSSEWSPEKPHPTQSTSRAGKRAGSWNGPHQHTSSAALSLSRHTLETDRQRVPGRVSGTCLSTCLRATPRPSSVP